MTRLLASFALAGLTACGPGDPPPRLEPVPLVSVETPRPTPSVVPRATSKVTPTPPPPDVSSAVALAKTLVKAFEQRDGVAIARLASDEGVRFSPYAYVSGSDLVLTPAELRGAFGDPKVRHWGAFDGTGDPIDLSFDAYVKRFVVDGDLSGARVAKWTHAAPGRLGSGNTIDNIADFYPNATWVEFHVPGRDPKYGGMDWMSLRLVFRRADDGLRLVGVVHDQWTI